MLQLYQTYYIIVYLNLTQAAWIWKTPEVAPGSYFRDYKNTDFYGKHFILLKINMLSWNMDLLPLLTEIRNSKWYLDLI